MWPRITSSVVSLQHSWFIFCRWPTGVSARLQTIITRDFRLFLIISLRILWYYFEIRYYILLPKPSYPTFIILFQSHTIFAAVTLFLKTIRITYINRLLFTRDKDVPVGMSNITLDTIYVFLELSTLRALSRSQTRWSVGKPRPHFRTTEQ
jgi:hypothetical protein